MKIFSVQQIRDLDLFTIEHEPVASIDLMERAAAAFVRWFSEKFSDRHQKIRIFCGPGNNGGDGLAIGRLLSQDHYEVEVLVLEIGDSRSTDFQTNWKRLQQARCCPVQLVSNGAAWPHFGERDIMVDAIFGSGLSRPIDGYWADYIGKLNELPCPKISVDIPSGMFADKPTTGVSFRADFTFSFEMPKLGFLFPENADRVGEWAVGSIGLHPGFIAKEKTPYYFLDRSMARSFLRSRKKYSHKGSYGHALLTAGAKGTIGAAVLSARALLRSGAGLLTIQAPACGYGILQSTVPEAMVAEDADPEMISEVVDNLNNYDAVGIGPGIGKSERTARALEEMLDKLTVPVVLDADALNILAADKRLLQKLPGHAILTPHPKEFERLFGPAGNNFARNELQRRKARELGVCLILKGAHTAVALPDGTCYFNSTGNPGMATGGSGDVLTGIITGLLAQGYQPAEAALFGVYLHGLAGDLAAAQTGQEALLASDIISQLGNAFLSLR